MVFQDPILAGATLVRDGIQSEGYVAGSAGWRINRDGTAEFNTGTFRGSVVVNNSTGAAAVTVDSGGVKAVGDDGSTVQLATGGVAQVLMRPPNAPGVSWVETQINTTEDGTTEHIPKLSIASPYNLATTRTSSIRMYGSGVTQTAVGIEVNSDTTKFTTATAKTGIVVVHGTNGRVSVLANNVEEPWHPVAFLNGWSNLGGGYVTMQYRRVASPPNSVQLVGVMNVGTKTSGAVIGNLPAGYRPLNKVRVPVSSNATNSGGQSPAFDIQVNGDITVASGSGFPAAATDCEINAVIPLDA